MVRTTATSIEGVSVARLFPSPGREERTHSSPSPLVASAPRRHDSRPPTPSPVPTALFLTVIWLLLASASSTLAATPGPSSGTDGALLDPSRFGQLHTQLGTIDRNRISELLATGNATAEHCRIGAGKTSCGCLRLRRGEWRIRATAFRHSKHRRTLQHLRAKSSNRRWNLFAARAVVTEGETVLEDVWILDGSGNALRTERATWSEGADEQLSLGSTRWGRARPSKSPDPCRRAARPSEMRRTELRAVAGNYGPRGWEFREVRLSEPFPLPLGRLRMRDSRPVGGVVPPRLTYAEHRVEIEDWIFDGASGVGASFAAAPTRWYGAGPALLTEAGESWRSLERGRPDLLSAQVLYDQERDDVGWVAVGAAQRGSPHVHVDGEFEEMGADSYWATRRLQRPGMLRPWRRSSVGLSLSSPDHYLQVRAAKWTPSPVGSPSERRREFLQTHLPGRQAALRIRFGLSRQLTEAVELSTDLYHRNMARADRVDDHGTTLATSLTARAGRAGGLFAEARTGGVVGTRLIRPSGDDSGEPTRGFDSRGATQWIAGARSGVQIRGDFEDVVHTIRPTLSIYREVVGAGGSVSLETPFAAPFARVPEWTLFAGLVEQSLRWPEVDLEFPTGVVLAGAGLDGAFGRAPEWMQRLEVGGGRWRLSGGGLIPLRAANVSWFGRAEYFVDQWTVALDATRLGPRELALVHADRILSRTHETLRLLEGQSRAPSGSSAPSPPVVETLSTAWTPGLTRLELRGFSVGLADRLGVGAGWTWRLPRMGWGLGVDGVYAAAGRGWGVTAGLRTVRRRDL